MEEGNEREGRMDQEVEKVYYGGCSYEDNEDWRSGRSR